MMLGALPHRNLPHRSSQSSALLPFGDCATRSQACLWSLTNQKTGSPVDDKRTTVMRHTEMKLSPQVEVYVGMALILARERRCLIPVSGSFAHPAFFAGSVSPPNSLSIWLGF